ncbi:hypothetical protein CHS0354_011087 [Potamilus streckersoni]|uniref:Lipase domain-containing protein n=1 Tax=Potamilus streckersoni TaxID=2493646 RepID=A0AAE0TKX5_9BIVA|nr:hypothetical protein CHS0354_011087 [Potamilus streckersoni]
MVVHGFLENGLVDWLKKMIDELLKTGDFNVILIDWGKGSGLPYTQATANSRVVGAEIAKLIIALKEHVGANPEDFHIIGQSLGAHIGGYAGERLPNLGRITGLDPAGPYFQYTDNAVRLDPTDAKFVDVIHTDGKSIISLGYGMIQPVGHVDFYPNSGVNQPGCDKNTITTLLSNLNVYNEGGCGYMDFHADRVKAPDGTTNVKYVLDTGDSKPFCRKNDIEFFKSIWT